MFIRDKLDNGYSMFLLPFLFFFPPVATTTVAVAAAAIATTTALSTPTVTKTKMPKTAIFAAVMVQQGTLDLMIV